MEANYLNLFYAGILYGQYSETGKKLATTGLAVKKLGREFPYLLGKGRGAAGRMLIYYALLPQYSKKARLSGKSVGWKRDTAIKILEKAEQKAAVEWGCREQIMTPEFGGTLTRIPLELLAVCLYRRRPFDRLCISLPGDAGEYDLEQALELMTPYLPRMRQVVLAGREFQEFMALQCLQGDRLRSVPLLLLRLLLRHRGLTGLMRQKHPRDICITITFRPIRLARQGLQEDQDAVKSGMEHLQNVRLCQCFQARQNFHMQSVQCLRHLSPTVPLHRQAYAHPLCHL